MLSRDHRCVSQRCFKDGFHFDYTHVCCFIVISNVSVHKRVFFAHCLVWLRDDCLDVNILHFEVFLQSAV